MDSNSKLLLYIHIPFCDSKCHYCAFNSYTSLHHLKDKYIESLCFQLKSQLEKIPFNSLETIFIGGGTPSTLNKNQFMKIFNILNPYLDFIDEITIEANPNSATTQWLKDMYSLGINRISFGVQSFNDEKLIFLNRNHNSKMAIEAIRNAKDIGFEHINCDIIYDTAMDSKELLDDDLEIIKTLPINHVSAYSLTLEEGTNFYKKSDVQVENIDLAKYFFKRLDDFGFTQYEISNFSRNDDAKSKHNLGYWQYKEYLGIGAGAVGCIGQKRLYTFKGLDDYIDNPMGYSEVEQLCLDDIKTEKILLGLRCEVGIDNRILNQKELSQVYNLEKMGKIKKNNDGRFYSTDFMLADELALYILG